MYLANRLGLSIGLLTFIISWTSSPAASVSDWPQWRGPDRNGEMTAPPWPGSLAAQHLQTNWHVSLGPSYSGPIVADDKVFVTESIHQAFEAVRAFDRSNGKELWCTEWEGYAKVPFFAKSNGDWIRSTPAYHEGRLYAAGMRDVLVCLDADSGNTLWRCDFVRQTGSPVPAFGFVSSPLIVGDAVFVQAGAALTKLNGRTGAILWQSLKDEGGMNGSAFSSPIHAHLGGSDQIVVQTRQKLAGVDPTDGRVLWEQPVKAFRGMNILTPVVYGDSIITSAYGGRAHRFQIRAEADNFSVRELWELRAEAYMSTPVLANGHAYLHLRNQRLTCLDLDKGTTSWLTDEKFGKYWSLVRNGEQILGLDQRGTLYLLSANPNEFALLDSRPVTPVESWAHLAVSGQDLFVRDLEGLTAWRWE